MSSIPDFIVGKIIATDYLGENGTAGTETSSPDFIRHVGDPGDDLLTAGLTEDQIGQPPNLTRLVANREKPTVAEIRRLAIYSNYTALMETNRGGGYGFLFGPKRVGKVLGREYLALGEGCTGRRLYHRDGPNPSQLQRQPADDHDGTLVRVAGYLWRDLNG